MTSLAAISNALQGESTGGDVPLLERQLKGARAALHGDEA